MNDPMRQIRLVIVSATGMVGGHALRYALDNPAVASVTVIGRRTLGISHPKLKEVLHQDFRELLSTRGSAHRSGCCDLLPRRLYKHGVRLRSPQNNRGLHNHVCARTACSSSPDAAFSFLSGMGADQTERSRAAFARYKGMAENALLKTGFPRVFIFRPAYIYPVEPRKEPNFGYRLQRWIYPVFRVLFPGFVIQSDHLARAMVDVVLREAGERGGVLLRTATSRPWLRNFNA